MNAVTIGTFDGVHLGHALLLRELRKLSRELNVNPLVLILSPHPLAVIAPDKAPGLLSTTAERWQLIRSILPDAKVEVLQFTPSLRSLTHSDFFKMLRDEYNARAVLMGYDNRFGSDRNATFDDYASTASRLGLLLRRADERPETSSSIIRDAVSSGDMEAARDKLGRPYSISGRVVEGHKIGRSIGFPTANLCPDSAELLKPSNGVYAAIASVEGEQFPAVVNIGNRPTLDNGSDLTIEAHLPDFTGSLYGKPMTISFIKKLRDEHRFPSIEDLSHQLAKDTEDALKVITRENCLKNPQIVR